MKKYIANSDISVSVTLPNKKSTRISFSALSNGMSVFYTSDEDIQWALEHHYKFGKLFRLAEDTPDEKPKAGKKHEESPISKAGKKHEESPISKAGKKTDKKTGKKTGKKIEKPVENPTVPNEEATDETADITGETYAENANSNDNSSGEENAPEYREVVVSDMDDAKDYLAENFDVVRTKLKNEDSIRETALSFGIIFKYL